MNFTSKDNVDRERGMLIDTDQSAVKTSVRVVPESRLAGLIDETWQDKLMSAPLGDWVVTENWRRIDNVRLRRVFD